MSFRLKTILGVALIQGVMLLFLIWNDLNTLRALTGKELISRAQLTVESIANLTRDVVLTTDLSRLESMVKSSFESSDLVYLRVMDSTQILVEMGRADALAKPFEQDVKLADALDGVFDVGVDIVEGDYSFGRVELGISVAQAEKILADARDDMFGIGLLSILLVALFSYLLGAYLTRGLDKLAQTARAISSGSLGAVVEIRGMDELADTGRALSTMSVRLAESQREMMRTVDESRALSVRLAEQEQRLATILDTAVDGFVTIDQHGSIDGINTAGAMLFGYDASELVGRNVSCLMPEPEQSAHDSYLQRYLNEGISQIIGQGRRVVGMKKDGSTFPMDLAVSEMAIGDQRMFVGLVRDLTVQLQAEADTRKLEAMRAAIVDANLDGLVTIDSSDRIVEFSAAAEKTFGYEREAVLGQYMADLLVPQSMRGMHWQGMQKYLRGGEGPVIGNRIEVQALHASGELFPVELTVQPINVEGERFFTAFVRDISKRKAAERALHDAKSRAELASEAKSRFLAHMSHEIRSPLNAVLGSLGLLLDVNLSADQRLYARTAEASSKILLRLINDILDFSKIEAGQVSLDKKDFTVRELVDDAMDLVAFKARDKGVYAASRVMPAVVNRVRGDAMRLRQVLNNLLDNALKFTDSGSVILTVDALDTTANEVLLRFTVEDSGVGIALHDQEHLFEEFQQVDSSDSTSHGGSGLGLSICHGLVTLMGGTIKLHSEPKMGSRFMVDVPLEFDAVDAERVDADAAVHQQGLMVGFEGRFADVLQMLCADAGCSVSRADNMRQASTMLSAAVDVLLVDSEHAADELDALAQQARSAGVPRLLLFAPATVPSVMQRVAGGQYDDLVLSPLVSHHIAESLQTLPAPAPQVVDAKRLGGFEPKAASPGARILLAEDSAANQMVATAMLRREGYVVEVAEDGRKAVELFRAGEYDLILMDLRMPDMDGLQATAAIRALPGGVQIPIIAMTANAMQQDVERCLSAGMDDFVPKPVDRSKLLAILERHLSLASTQARAQESGGRQAESVIEHAGGPLISDEVLRQLAEDVGEKAVPSMLDMFLNEMTTRGSSVVKALDCSAMECLEDEAHTLKSCAGTFGAIRLQSLARDIETACRQGNWADARNLGAGMSELVRQTQEVFRQRLDGFADSRGER